MSQPRRWRRRAASVTALLGLSTIVAAMAFTQWMLGRRFVPGDAHVHLMYDSGPDLLTRRRSPESRSRAAGS